MTNKAALQTSYVPFGTSHVRRIGSRYTLRLWSVRHAAFLEVIYDAFAEVLLKLHWLWNFIGYSRIERPVVYVEKTVKGFLFDCRMCGECALSDSGMSCPMNCPKGLRNGPCGGVLENGHCEIETDMPCVWVEAWKGSQTMRAKDNILKVQKPIDHSQHGSSAWLRVTARKASERKAAPEHGGERGVMTEASPSKDLSVMLPGHTSRGRLERVLRGGEFAVTAELNPPDSADPNEVYERGAILNGWVDGINATDGSGANCHMSSVGICALLTRVGYAPIMQISCRDRNRIAIQGDVLGAAAMGVSNILCLTGDGVQAGDQPGAKPVFDLDSMSLLETIRIMRDEGKFLSGRKITQPPRLFLGAAINPFSPPFDFRPARLAKKIEAGAQFVQSQYCFDVPMLEKYMKRVLDMGLHEKCFILIGVGPLASARSARWIRNHVPGVHIPEAVIERLEGAQDPKQEGKKICIEIMQQIKEMDGVSGVHMMAYRQEELVAEIVHESGVLMGRKPWKKKNPIPKMASPSKPLN